MLILSEAQKKRKQVNACIRAEYESLIKDGTTPFVAKEYLAKKYGCSVTKVYLALK